MLLLLRPVSRLCYSGPREVTERLHRERRWRHDAALSLSLSLRAFSKSKGSPKARRTRPALRHFERWVFPTSIVIRGRKSLPVMRFIGSMSMPWKLAVGELEKIGIKKIQFPTFPNFLLSLSLSYISMYSPKDKRTGYRIARVMVIRKKGIVK